MLVTFLRRPWWPFDVNPLKLAWSSGGLVCRDKQTPYLRMARGAVLGRISAGFGSRGFGFGDDFSPTVFGFRAPKPIGFCFGFGFPPMDIQWISEINNLELKLMFYNMLIITYLLRLLNLF